MFIIRFFIIIIIGFSIWAVKNDSWPNRFMLILDLLEMITSLDPISYIMRLADFHRYSFWAIGLLRGSKLKINAFLGSGLPSSSFSASVHKCPFLDVSMPNQTLKTETEGFFLNLRKKTRQLALIRMVFSEQREEGAIEIFCITVNVFERRTLEWKLVRNGVQKLVIFIFRSFISLSFVYIPQNHSIQSADTYNCHKCHVYTIQKRNIISSSEPFLIIIIALWMLLFRFNFFLLFLFHILSGS